MLRLVLGIVAGLVLAVVLVGAFEMAGHAVFPPPAGIDLKDPAQLAAVMDRIPLAAKLWVVGAWTLATAIAGLVAAVTAKRAWAAWVVAGAVGVLAAATVLMIPHPTWMKVAAVAGPALGGWLAVLAARRILAR